MLKAEDQFHVGIVVDDLEATEAELSALFGHRWCPEIGGPTEVSLPGGGTAVLDLRCAYSSTEPRLEVVRRIPGTLWEPEPGSRLHHVGYWSDDVGGDVAELERHGYVIEATREGADGAPFFAFLRGAAGFRVELVTRAVRPSLEKYWSPAAPAAAGSGA
ncbi:hypothetical protein OK074_2253 [Actinobacteria bacterium OK074]|nr:hypothetical protein OK074_2253 [Actinobacteria bacterium OK074]